jgi:hypothetical protein
MPAMCSANRGDAPRMSRGREPIVNRRANFPALHRRLAGTVMAGDKQNDPVSPRDRLLERMVDRIPCSIEIVTVKVEDAIRFDLAGAELAVPAAVQRTAGNRSNRRNLGWSSRPFRGGFHDRLQWISSG